MIEYHIGEQKVIGYHFLEANKRLNHGDGRLVEVGKTFTTDFEPELHLSGLHASKRAIDALAYATGPIVCKVKLGGTIIHGDDRSVGTERTCLEMIDATRILQDFSRLCALDVVHLWDAPEVVIQFLKTGDPTLQIDSWDIASNSIETTREFYHPGTEIRKAAWSASSAYNAASIAWKALTPIWCTARNSAQTAAHALAWTISLNTPANKKDFVWDITRSTDLSDQTDTQVIRHSILTAAKSSAKKRQNQRLAKMLSQAWLKPHNDDL